LQAYLECINFISQNTTTIR